MPYLKRFSNNFIHNNIKPYTALTTDDSDIQASAYDIAISKSLLYMLSEIEKTPKTDELLELTEQIAAHAHDVWAAGRITEGWQYGPERNDKWKEHPCLVPFDELPENEKEYDRKMATETLKVIQWMGFQITHVD